ALGAAAAVSAPPRGEARESVQAVQNTSPSSTTIVIEGGPDDTARKRRLNPIKQKQMEDRCAFLEEEVPRVGASLAHTEQQLGVFISAAETERLTKLAEELRAQAASLTEEWEELMLQLENA
ncbi:MAG: ABC transporter ATP-binding protein, partial [Acidobacteriota bacterium]|nr:ABC transporter ATP-binding protein [Acidobacteriota bacterium]